MDPKVLITDEWDLQQSKPHVGGTVDSRVVRVTPKSLPPVGSGDQIVFQVNHTSEFLNLSKGYFVINLAIEKANGSSLVTNTDFVALKYGAPLFQNAILSSEGHIIEICNDVDLAIDMKRKLYYSSTHFKNGGAQHWYIDDGACTTNRTLNGSIPESYVTFRGKVVQVTNINKLEPNPDYIQPMIPNPDYVPEGPDPEYITNPAYIQPTIPNPAYEPEFIEGSEDTAGVIIPNPAYDVNIPETIPNPDYIQPTIPNPEYDDQAPGSPQYIPNPAYIPEFIPVDTTPLNVLSTQNVSPDPLGNPVDLTITANSGITINSYPNDNFNHGFKDRYSIASGSKVFAVCVPLREIFAYFRDVEKITRDIEYTITLIRTPSVGRSLQGSLGNPNDGVRIKYHNMELFIPNPVPNQNVLTNWNKNITSKQSAKHSYEVMDVVRTQFIINTGSPVQNFTINIPQARRVTKVHLAYMYANTLTNLSIDTWQYHNMSISHLELYINEKLVSSLPIKISPSGDWIRPYQQYATNQGGSIIDDNGVFNAPGLTYDEFYKNYTVYIFPTGDLDASLFTANTTIRISVQAPNSSMPNPVTPVIFYEYLETVEFYSDGSKMHVKRLV